MRKFFEKRNDDLTAECTIVQFNDYADIVARSYFADVEDVLDEYEISFGEWVERENLWDGTRHVLPTELERIPDEFIGLIDEKEMDVDVDKFDDILVDYLTELVSSGDFIAVKYTDEDVLENADIIRGIEKRNIDKVTSAEFEIKTGKNSVYKGKDGAILLELDKRKSLCFDGGIEFYSAKRRDVEKDVEALIEDLTDAISNMFQNKEKWLPEEFEWFDYVLEQWGRGKASDVYSKDVESDDVERDLFNYLKNIDCLAYLYFILVKGE